LVDVLEKMHLLPSDEKKEIHQFLRQTKQNLLIKSDLESYPEQEDIIKNLFNIICSILNLQLNQRSYNYLDERLVFKQLDQIVFDRDDQDLVLID